jgi:imidazolonepropionase-like amidohydrolase
MMNAARRDSRWGTSELVRATEGVKTMSDELPLKTGLIITVDDNLGDLHDADVLIRNGVIVGGGSGKRTAIADAEVIDCKGRPVVPASSTPTGTFGRERSAP